MVNFKKMDDHDFIFVNKSLTTKEEKEFSTFLKERKSRTKTKKNLRIVKRTKRELA